MVDPRYEYFCSLGVAAADGTERDSAEKRTETGTGGAGQPTTTGSNNSKLEPHTHLEFTIINTDQSKYFFYFRRKVSEKKFFSC